MERAIISLFTAAVVSIIGWGTAIAQDGDDGFKVIPVELFACTYNDRKGPDDLDAVIGKWNAWADARKLDDYAAWTLTPYYFGPGDNAGFDVLWLGAGKDAVGLGKAQDDWLANNDGLDQEFDKVLSCDAHANMASVNHKPTPKGATPENSVLTFSDCNYKKDTTFDALSDAMGAWSQYMSNQGSDAGIFHWYPVYGAGGEKYSFKWIETHANLEAVGVDYEIFGNGRGFERYNELFSALIECDSSRVYLAKSRRYVQLR